MSGRSGRIERRIARLERALQVAQGPDERETSLLALEGYQNGNTTPPEEVRRDPALLSIWRAMIDFLRVTERGLGLYGPDGPPTTG